MKGYKEYDVIVLKMPIEGADVPVGARGTILLLYEWPSEAYEVEFMNGEDSYGAFTLTVDQIEPWER